ncbi:MAG: hypothetical protein ACTSPV_07210 [Candidatus Hodarchaeales archaeon]
MKDYKKNDGFLVPRFSAYLIGNFLVILIFAVAMIPITLVLSSIPQLYDLSY